MVTCPNINSPQWKELVDQTDLQTAYSIFMGKGNTLPFIGNDSNNILLDNLNKEYNLKKIENNIIRNREFSIETANKILEEINSNNGGYFNASLVDVPNSNNVHIVIEGYPIPNDEIKGRSIEDVMKELSFKHADDHVIPLPTIPLDGYEQRFYYDDMVIPLTEGRSIYEKYNLLNNKGEIKTVKYNTIEEKKSTNRWVESLNKSPYYHFEVRKTPVGHKIFIINKFSVSDYEQRVDYMFKVITALDKIQRNNFEQSKIQGWINDLQKQGVSTSQIEMFKEIAKDGMSKQDIAASIAAEYSHTIEMSRYAAMNRLKISFDTETNQYYIIDDNDIRHFFNTKSEATAFQKNAGPKEGFTKKHISNSAKNENNEIKYRKQDGWEYVELDIVTPLMSQTTKSHAFFTNKENSIGWVRLWVNKSTGVIEVQEIQSDLFQKDRNKFKDNRLIQLLNEDSAWVTFFTKSIMQYAAKQGYNAVRFPGGETAARAQNHTLSKQELESENLQQLKPVEGFYEISLRNILINIFGKWVNTNPLENKYDKYEAREDKYKKIKSFKNASITSEEFDKHVEGVKEHKDEHNNKWYEIPVDSFRDLKNIALQKEEENVTHYTERPQDVLIRFLNSYGFEIHEAENLFINLAAKKINLNTSSISDISKALSAPLADMLSYSDYFYEIQKSVRDSYKYKILVNKLRKIHKTSNRTVINRLATKQIFKEFLESGFNEELAKKLNIDKTLLDKIKDFIRNLINSLQKINLDRIDSNISEIVEKTFKGEEFIRLTKKDNYVKVNFQEAFDDNSIAKDIMTKLGIHPSLILTGSIAYSTQGTVYRRKGTIVHDLDFVNDYLTLEEINELVFSNYPDSVKAYSFFDKYNVDTYLIPPKGIKIQNIKRRDTGKITSFELVDNNNNIVGTYKLEFEISGTGKTINEIEIKTGVEAMLVDFFTNDKKERKTVSHEFIGSDNKKHIVKLSKFEIPFEAKLRYSRFKDIWDYNRFVPNDFKPFNFQKSSTPLMDRAEHRIRRPMTTERRKQIDKQKSLLLRVFPTVLEVIEDYNLPVLGTLEAGGTIVRINPEKMRDDTLFHEFGHLLIDLMGGMSNELISKARQALVGSKAEASVLRRYGDLVGTEKFDKEVVAEALGLEADKVWKDREKLSRWEILLDDILNILKNLLRINRSEIRKLARTLVKGKEFNYSRYESKASTYVQAQRSKIEDFDFDINVIKEAYQEISNSVTFNEKDHTYKLIDTDLTPVSTIMNEAGFGLKKGEETEAVIRGQKLGTTLHKNAEGIINKVSGVISTDTGFEFTKKAHEDLQGILNSIFGDKYLLISEVIVPDVSSKSAGTIDVIAIDKNGDQHIFDFKTKELNKGGFAYYDSSRFGKSQRTINTLQLSLYKDIIKRTLKQDIKSINIIQINAEINKYNKIIGVSVDTNHSTNGVVRLKYDPMAADLLNRRAKNIKQEEAIKAEDIDPESIEFKNKIFRDEVLDKYQRLYEQALDTVSENLNNARSKGWTSESERLEEVLDRLNAASINPKRGIAIFVQEAISRIDSLHKLYLKREAEEKAGLPDVWNASIFMKWHEYMSAYDMLEDISNIILSEGTNLDKSQTLKYRMQLNDAISKKNLLKNLYKEKGITRLAEEYAHLSTRIKGEYKELKRKEWIEKNKDSLKSMTKEDRIKKMNEYAEKYIEDNATEIHDQTKLRLEAELLKSNQDIGYLAKWLDTILNTNDMVVAATVKDFVIQHEKSRLEVINMRQEMIPLLRELEEFMKYSTTDPVEKLYDWMLEKDKGGNYTGHLLQKYSSALIEAENKMMESTKHLPSAKRKAERNKWRAENGIEMDWESFNKGYIKKALEMLKDGKITEKEFDNFENSIMLPHRKVSKLSSIISNSDAADELMKWKYDNILEFRVVTDPKWINDGWEELQTILENPNDPRAKWYNFIIDLNEKINSPLPIKSKLHNTLPAISKSLTESIHDGMPVKDAIKLNFQKSLGIHAEDESLGIRRESHKAAPTFFLPTYYTRGDNYDLRSQSYDLATLYFNAFKMSSNYKHSNEIIGRMELAKKLITDRDYVVTDAKGNPIKKSLNSLREKHLTKSGQTSLLASQLEDFMKNLLYKDGTVDLGTFEIFGAKVDRNKLIDTLNGYSAINMLGLNFIQGIANVSLGEIHQITEALAGEYITVKDLHNATAFYMKPENIGEVLGDIGSRSSVSLLNLLNEKWNILNEYEGGTYIKSTKFSQLMNTNSLFFTSRMGEHFMQTRTMLAMLHKIEAKDSNGKVLGSMRDMYTSENGKLVLDPRVDLKKSNWSQEQQILFGMKVKRVLARLNGEYSELGKLSIQRYALGRSALMFRKFMYPGFEKRYGKLKYNEFLEDYTEGSYRQFGRFFKTIAKDLKNLEFALIKEKFDTLLPREQANIIRALTEWSFALAAIGISGALLGALEGAEDDEKWALALATYQARRLRSELLFFTLAPSEVMNILVSPAASISTIQNMTEFMAQLVFNPFERYERGDWKGELKLTKDVVNLTPVVRQWYRITGIENHIRLFDFN